MHDHENWITPCAWPRSFQKVVYFCNMGIMLWPVAVRKATWSLISRTRTDTDPSVHLCNKRAHHIRGWDQVHLHSRETERRIESYVICDQVWWPILGICALHLTNPKCAHTHREHTPGAVGSHLLCRAASCGAGEQLGVRCLAQGHLSHGIEGGESAVHSLPPPTIPAGPNSQLLGYESDFLTIRPWLPRQRIMLFVAIWKRKMEFFYFI